MIIVIVLYLCCFRLYSARQFILYALTVVDPPDVDATLNCKLLSASDLNAAVKDNCEVVFVETKGPCDTEASPGAPAQ